MAFTLYWGLSESLVAVLNRCSGNPSPLGKFTDHFTSLRTSLLLFFVPFWRRDSLFSNNLNLLSINFKRRTCSLSQYGFHLGLRRLLLKVRHDRPPRTFFWWRFIIYLLQVVVNRPTWIITHPTGLEQRVLMKVIAWATNHIKSLFYLSVWILKKWLLLTHSLEQRRWCKMSRNLIACFKRWLIQLFFNRIWQSLSLLLKVRVFIWYINCFLVCALFSFLAFLL